MTGVIVARIPKDDLAELWFGLKHSILEKLQKKVREKKINQKNIAKRIGKAEATVSRCLSGRVDMDIRTMHDLARGMGCRLRIELDDLDMIPPSNRRRHPITEAPEPGSPATRGNRPMM